MTFQIGTSSAPSYVDKRRSYKDEFESRVVVGPVVFTSNAAGTTTTLSGVNASPSTGINVVRLDDEFKLFDSAGVLKYETVFRVTAVTVGGSTIVTFAPAAPVATASGDRIRLVQSDSVSSTGNKDRRLADLGFSPTYISKLTENDKNYQLRVSDDPGSI